MAETKKKIVKPPVKYRIEEIKEEKFYINNLPQEILDQIDKNRIKIGFGVLLKPNLAEDKLTIGFKVVYTYDINGTEEEIIVLEFHTTFTLENYKPIISKDAEGLVNINDKFLINLFGIIIGTARGILCTKTRGSILNQFYLPVLDPKEVLLSLKPKKKKSD